jgi:chromosome segregation ATPase
MNKSNEIIKEKELQIQELTNKNLELLNQSNGYKTEIQKLKESLEMVNTEKQNIGFQLEQLELENQNIRKNIKEIQERYQNNLFNFKKSLQTNKNKKLESLLASSTLNNIENCISDLANVTKSSMSLNENMDFENILENDIKGFEFDQGNELEELRKENLQINLEMIELKDQNEVLSAKNRQLEKLNNQLQDLNIQLQIYNNDLEQKKKSLDLGVNMIGRSGKLFKNSTISKILDYLHQLLTQVVTKNSSGLDKDQTKKVRSKLKRIYRLIET